MKVGFLITGLDVGGAQQHLLKLVPRLKMDVFVVSLTSLDAIGKKLEDAGVKVYYLGFNGFNLAQVIMGFRKILRTEGPDVLDCYLPHAGLFGRLFGRCKGRKILYSVRNDYSDLKVLSWMDRVTRGLVDLFVPNSQALISYVTHQGVLSDKIKVLPNGVDVGALRRAVDERYDVRDELGISKDAFVVMYVGRLHPQKNLDLLITAAKSFRKGVYLVLVGGGPDRKRLIDLADESFMDNVQFLGERHDVPSLLNSADVFVLPSFKEGMSNALLEAMALGKPVLVSSIPQNECLMEYNVNGFSFEPDRPYEVSMFVNDHLSKPDVLKHMSRQSKRLSKQYNINKVAREYARLVEEVVRK